MNNEAFRKLLNSSGGNSAKKDRKSTKEIAREVVEEEFRERRQKRGRDEDYLSDDDDNADDDDDDDQDNRDINSKKKSKKEEEKELAEEEAKAAKAEEKKNKKLKYRDRAKERRLGKGNIDYQDTQDIANQLDEDMSKFLGGDEEHTHLVKGLDKTLAEKVRRDEMGNQATGSGDIDLDQIMEEASAKVKENRKSVTSSSEKKPISELKPNKPTTLACGMLSYLKQLEERREMDIPHKDSFNYSSGTGEMASQAGQMLSRTNLTFSLDGNINDRDKSSELPEEKTMSIMHYERLQSRKPFTTCTPLDSNLISKIMTVLSSVRREQKEVQIKNGSKKKAGKKVEQEISKQQASDSDDDIFADAGKYVPPTKAMK
jgi:hypothetical protein